MSATGGPISGVKRHMSQGLPLLALTRQLTPAALKSREENLIERIENSCCTGQRRRGRPFGPRRDGQCSRRANHKQRAGIRVQLQGLQAVHGQSV